MRKLMLIFFTICLSAAAESGSLSSLYSTAANMYESGEFEKAASLYEMMIDKGVSDADVFYNLGNAYFRQGLTGRAVLNYKKAYLHEPFDEDIRYNLNFARSKVQGRLKLEGKNPVMRILFFPYYSFSANGSALLALILLSVCAAFIILYIFFNKELIRKVSFFAVIMTALFSVGFAAASIVRYNTEYGIRPAVLVEESLVIYSGTGESYEELMRIYPGTEFSIKEKRSGWIKISLANGVTGWVKSGYVRKVI